MASEGLATRRTAEGLLFRVRADMSGQMLLPKKRLGAPGANALSLDPAPCLRHDGSGGQTGVIQTSSILRWRKGLWCTTELTTGRFPLRTPKRDIFPCVFSGKYVSSSTMTPKTKVSLNPIPHIPTITELMRVSQLT